MSGLWETLVPCVARAVHRGATYSMEQQEITCLVRVELSPAFPEEMPLLNIKVPEGNSRTISPCAAIYNIHNGNLVFIYVTYSIAPHCKAAKRGAQDQMQH